MPRLKARRGAGLAEMIVALTLAAIVSVAGATALAGAERYTRRARGAADARRMLREAEAILMSELRAAPSDSFRVNGDTAVDFLGLVGVSVICVSSGEVLVLPPDAASGGYPYSSWRASPEAGDLLAAFDTSAGVWRTAVVDTASTRVSNEGCVPAGGLVSTADSAARRPVTRVVLHSPLAAGAAWAGSPVRVVRSGRYVLTKAADGSWSLSYRRCTGSCGVAQPVVGPLAAPADSGLAFADTATGARVEVTIRTPGPRSGAPWESAVLRIALRNLQAGIP